MTLYSLSDYLTCSALEKLLQDDSDHEEFVTQIVLTFIPEVERGDVITAGLATRVVLAWEWRGERAMIKNIDDD